MHICVHVFMCACKCCCVCTCVETRGWLQASSSVAFHPIWVLGIELRLSSLHGSILPTEASLQPLTWLTGVYSYLCGGTYISGAQSTYHLRCSHSSIIHHCFLRQGSHWSGAHQLEEAGYQVSYKDLTISTSLALEYSAYYWTWLYVWLAEIKFRPMWLSFTLFPSYQYRVALNLLCSPGWLELSSFLSLLSVWNYRLCYQPSE